jgi:large subunit ribosomal protein L16
MLQPKQTKYKKVQKGRNRGLAYRGNKVSFGEYALQSVEYGKLTSRQIEAARRAMTRHVRRGGNLWIRAFPDKPITEKPLEVRQGKGKGNVEYWVALVQPGRVLYEISGVSEEIVMRAFELAAAKLPFKCQVIKRNVR